jgi:ubiquinone/menaquinone biosynthesis C-methylase UbiE
VVGASPSSWDSYLRAEFVERALGSRPGHRQGFVLDVGAGTSRFVQDRFSTESELIRVDLSRNDPINVVCSVTSLPFRNGAFELVLAFRVLQHVSREKEALEEILRVTKPGGTIVVAVANRNSWTLLSLHRDNQKLRKRIPYAHYELYRRVELETKLKQTGFVRIRIWSAIFLPEVINRFPTALTRILLRLGVTLDRVARRIPFVQNMGTNLVALGVKS